MCRASPRSLGTYFWDASVTPTHHIFCLSSPMPYVDLVSGDDYVSIWYTTNSPHNSVSTFDPTKPTKILRLPFSLDSSWLEHALVDPRLNEDYNMIAFDLRFSGKTIERPNARLDCWVQAADLAFACEVCPASSSLVAIPRFGVLGLTLSTPLGTTRVSCAPMGRRDNIREHCPTVCDAVSAMSTLWQAPPWLCAI